MMNNTTAHKPFVYRKNFVSVHSTQSSADMNRLDDVYATVKAVNELLGTTLEVSVEFTDGIRPVDANVASHVEAFVTTGYL